MCVCVCGECVCVCVCVCGECVCVHMHVCMPCMRVSHVSTNIPSQYLSLGDFIPIKILIYQCHVDDDNKLYIYI